MCGAVMRGTVALPGSEAISRANGSRRNLGDLVWPAVACVIPGRDRKSRRRSCRGTDEESDGCVVPLKHRTKPTEIGGGDGGGKAAGRREGKQQRMLRTQCRAQHVTEAACLRIVASKPKIAFDLRREPTAGKLHGGMTAHWLKQMGRDVHILDRGLERVALETGSGTPASGAPSAAPDIEPAEAARWLAEGAVAVSLETSSEFRQAHPDGAVWSIRPRLDQLPASVLKSDRLVLFTEDEASAQLAAVDLAELTSAQLAVVCGGTRGWARAGLPVTASPGEPSDEERIDFLFWNHDRHAGNQNAMRAYLQWERELPAQIAADGLSGFRLAAP